MANKKPLGTRTVNMFDDLKAYLRETIKQRNYQFLWIKGHWGLGKSETLKALLRELKLTEDVTLIKSGRTSALGCYIKVWEHKNKPVVLDVDRLNKLLNDDDYLRLLISLGENTVTKEPLWNTTTNRLVLEKSQANGEVEKVAVPKSFTTRSPLVVIANDFPLEPALLSRAILISFEPSQEEVHRYAATWFYDQEIHDYFGKNLFYMLPLDVRWYVHAYQDKKAGRPWKDIVKVHYSIGNEADYKEVRDLENKPEHKGKKREEKANLFKEKTGRSRATYYETYAYLKDNGLLERRPGVPPIPVQGTAPRDLTPEDEQEGTPPSDLPAGTRDAFTRPIVGINPPSQPRAASDDSVGWERPKPPDED